MVLLGGIFADDYNIKSFFVEDVRTKNNLHDVINQCSTFDCFLQFILIINQDYQDNSKTAIC